MHIPSFLLWHYVKDNHTYTYHEYVYKVLDHMKNMQRCKVCNKKYFHPYMGEFCYKCYHKYLDTEYVGKRKIENMYTIYDTCTGKIIKAGTLSEIVAFSVKLYKHHLQTGEEGH